MSDWNVAADRPPEPYRTIARKGYWKDKRWFEAHPDVTEYERDYIDGEFWFDGDEYSDPVTIRKVRVSLMDMFETDPPERGLIRVRTPIPYEEPLGAHTDPEDAVNWMLHDGPPD